MQFRPGDLLIAKHSVMKGKDFRPYVVVLGYVQNFRSGLAADAYHVEVVPPDDSWDHDFLKMTRLPSIFLNLNFRKATKAETVLFGPQGLKAKRPAKHSQRSRKDHYEKR